MQVISPSSNISAPSPDISRHLRKLVNITSNCSSIPDSTPVFTLNLDALIVSVLTLLLHNSFILIFNSSNVLLDIPSVFCWLNIEINDSNPAGILYAAVKHQVGASLLPSPWFLTLRIVKPALIWSEFSEVIRSCNCRLLR